jgi:hypothetical protein
MLRVSCDAQCFLQARIDPKGQRSGFAVGHTLSRNTCKCTAFYR